ncbi:MAG: DUF1269 domain-containing protein [Cyanobacteria bacterium J06638_22]
MATLTVWKFDSAEGAGNAISKLLELQKQELVKVEDAAIVSWPQERSKPQMQQAVDLVGTGAIGGMFWGMLFGLIFLVPFWGAAIGAATGALTGKFSDYGINDDFIKEMRDKVQKGTSALFLMTGQVTIDKVRDAFKDELPHMQLVESNLSQDQEARLRQDFDVDAAM